jgi:predicted DCC family thiol-disulfide oxidoreductase YuxK
MTTAIAPGRTLAPGGSQLVVLYDGHCRFCTQSAKAIARRFGTDHVRTVNFQDDGVLASYPGVSYDACMKKMHVIDPAGRVYGGAGAVARITRLTPFIGWMAYLYYVPILRQLADAMYWFIAKYRYKLFGKKVECEPGGTCHLH